jgi:transposase
VPGVAVGVSCDGEEHYAYLLRMMFDRVDALTAPTEALTTRIEEVIAPFAHQVAQLDEITGVGRTGAQELIAEFGKGNPWIAATLGEAAMSAARTKTFLGSRYHRLARRRGKQRALVAAGNSILTIAYHLLSDPDAHFTDLGPHWHDRIAPLRRKRLLIAELERLSGKKVLLQEGTA